MGKMKKYESYKDSGIEWIGEIPSHWDCKRLKQLVESPLKYGANEAAESDDPSQPRYIRITDFGQNGILRDDTFKSLPEHLANEYLLEEGDILLARSGATVGKTFLFQNYKGKACFAGYLIRCRFSKEQVDSRFINYYTFSNFYENWKQSIFQQATIQNIGADKYNQLLVSIPPQSEQAAIANYLDQKTAQIDELIAKKERLIQLLEEERTALINQAVTKGLDPNVPMKDSGIEWLGEIPAHWEVKKLKFVANLKSGENITSENIKEDGDYPVYGGNGLRGYYSDYTNDGEYILIGRQGALCGNIKYASNRFWASEHAIVCYLKPNVNWLWFGKLLESMNLNQYNQSAAQPGLAVGVIKNLSIPIPNIENQNEIVEFIIDFERRTDDIIQKTRKEIELLKEYKTALISEVVTGKVDVRDEKLN